MMKTVLVLPTLVAVVCGAVGPTMTLNNGVVMPQMALGTFWRTSIRGHTTPADGVPMLLVS